MYGQAANVSYTTYRDDLTWAGECDPYRASGVERFGDSNDARPYYTQYDLWHRPQDRRSGHWVYWHRSFTLIWV